MEIEHLYTQYKPLLLSISYRMLGTITEAEDLVHEIFADLHGLKLERIDNVKAYLCRMVTNRCIDLLKSAQKRREVYIGPWLPEPLIFEDNNDPFQLILQQDQITYAMLTLMEQLNPIERAVFVLREAFDFSYKEIANLLEKEEVNCRKIVSRAKRKLQLNGDIHPQNNNQTNEVNQLITQFVYAAKAGKMEELIRYLCEDAILYSDGGGHVTAALRPIVSSGRVVQFILGLVKKYSLDSSMKVELKNINGQTGLLIESDQEPASIVCFDIENTRIKQIFVIRNPEKLRK